MARAGRLLNDWSRHGQLFAHGPLDRRGIKCRRLRSVVLSADVIEQRSECRVGGLFD